LSVKLGAWTTYPWSALSNVSLSTPSVSIGTPALLGSNGAYGYVTP
jgi:hypothetical protein